VSTQDTSANFWQRMSSMLLNQDPADDAQTGTGSSTPPGPAPGPVAPPPGLAPPAGAQPAPLAPPPGTAPAPLAPPMNAPLPFPAPEPVDVVRPEERDGSMVIPTLPAADPVDDHSEDELTREILDAIARGRRDRTTNPATESVPSPFEPEPFTPEPEPFTPEAFTPEPEPEPAIDDELDRSIGLLQLVAVSASRAASVLPDGAVTLPLATGLLGAVTIPSGDGPRFVAENQCEAWGITVPMVLSVAHSNTRENSAIDQQTVSVNGDDVIVVESGDETAASSLAWIEELAGMVLPVGALVLVASPRLMVVQATHRRSPETVDTLLDFVRSEAPEPSPFLAPLALVQTADGLEIVADLASAAGRLRLATATERLTGAEQLATGQAASAATPPTSPLTYS
jgi:hypothetical protein